MPDIAELIETAIKAREKAYAPYSNFLVGAALTCKGGELYSGCNIESASYSPSNCAERTAFFKAVSDGKRNFTSIAIVGGAKESGITDYCPPCGVCRQVMMEFCDPETFEIILAKSKTDFKVYKLKDLMPQGFGPKNLNL